APQSIFESFHQAKNHKDDGAGLGLSNGRQHRQLQNGEIWVETEEGKGSAFPFTLPVAKDASLLDD
uniref:ATP-binding protein n=1 Tax=Bacillus sp. GbtcB13 TaxID=2824758 RepID=UPI0020C5DD93